MSEQSSAPFEVVRVYDPAIDDRVGRMRAEYAALRDMSKLRFRDDVKPMIFRCRRLNSTQRRKCQEASTDAERNERAYAYGVLEIRNFPNDPARPESGGGYTYTPHRADPDLRMSDDSLDKVGGIDVQEVGGVIWHQSFLAVGVPVRVPLPDTSRDACLQVLAHLAEQTRASRTPPAAPSDSTEPSEQPKAPRPRKRSK